jgi:5-methylcytosine-specific restriction endonuclease McrA
MRKIAPPNFTVSDAIAACLAHVAVPERAKRLENARAHLMTSEKGYHDHAAAISLHTIEPTEDVHGLLSRNEMIALYEGNFSRTKTKGRELYDALRAGATNGICPLCGVQRASTLDHHLAKSEHPAFAITPINLVPSCSDCNHSKSVHQPAASDEQALHPYYDDIDDARWLFARVVEEQPVSLVYFASPPSGWDTTKRARVLRHFGTLNLARLYTSQSSDDLPSMRFRLERLLSVSGAQGVRQQLLEELDDRLKDSNNSWQIAMLDALSGSDWYCSGGFVIA